MMVDRGSSASKPKFKFKLTVPPLAWTVLDLAMAIALTAGVTFVIMVINGLLVGKGTYQQGFDAWLGFVQRPDIIGTTIVTALVSAVYLSWRNPRR